MDSLKATKAVLRGEEIESCSNEDDQDIPSEK